MGAGTPTPSPKRFGTCYVAALDDELLMFDCGPASTHKLTRMGLWPTDVNHLFFSHHHFDHNVDYPCFLLCRWDQSTEKTPPLNVYGPTPTREVTELLIGPKGAFFPDWQARVEHPGSLEIYQSRGGRLPRRPPLVEVREIDGGESVNRGGWRVSCARVKHIEPWMPTLAYRLEFGGTSLVITSDTGYCRGIIDFARGADHLLVHCWDLQSRMRPAEAGMITGTLEAARIASEAGVSSLLLSHLGPRLDRPDDRKKAEDDIAGVFHGEFRFLDELSTIPLEGRPPSAN